MFFREVGLPTRRPSSRAGASGSTARGRSRSAAGQRPPARGKADERRTARAPAGRAASLYARSLIEASLDPLVTISPEGKITDVNRATEAVTGVSRERLIGSSFSDYFTQPDRADAGYHRVLREGLVRDYPLTIRHASGRTTDVLYNATVYRNEEGEVQGVFAAARDVTERRRMEEEVRTASLYARSLIEASLDPLVTISPEGKITDVNRATELATGVRRAQLIGSDFSSYFTEPEKAARGYRKVISEGQVLDYSLTLRHVSGRTIDVLYNASVYRNEAGEVQGVFAAARDVTERRRMEEELRAASLYARSLIEASLDPLVTISPEGKVTDVNRATEEVTGVGREQLIGSSFSDYFTEPDKANAGYQRVIARGQVVDYPLTIRHASGKTTDVLYNATVYRDQEGAAQGVFAAARDITERKEAERRRDLTNALLELFARKSSSQEYLDSVVETMRAWTGCEAVGIRLVEAEGGIPYAASVGFPPEFLQQEGRLAVGQDDCWCVRAITEAVEPADRALLTPGHTFRCDRLPEFLAELPGEQRRHYRTTCARFGFKSLAVIPLRHHDEMLGAIHLVDRRRGRFSAPTVEFLESMAPLIGEAVHRFRAEAELARYRDHLEELVALRTSELEAANSQLLREVRQRQRAEQSLRVTAEELARSNQDLEQFAYVASHDLQEPLRAVAGYLGLIEARYRSLLDDKGRHHLDGAVQGASRMHTLINDLLRLSRVDTRAKEFAEVGLDAVLEGALNDLSASIQEAGASITRDPLPALRVDGAQMTQLFQNLIGNALKFRSETPPRIHVGAERRDHEWLFSVRDNGIGIEPQYFQRIFLIFQRLHTRSQYPGTGIGLAICKKIIERHGGAIWVESRPGEGSTFHFTLPDRGTS